MPDIKLTWTGRRPAVLDVAPLAVTIRNSRAPSLLVAPDEPFPAPSDGTIDITASLPRYKTLHAQFSITGDTITLNADDLLADFKSLDISLETPYVDLPLRRADGTLPGSAQRKGHRRPVIEGRVPTTNELVSNRAGGRVDVVSNPDALVLSSQGDEALSTVLRVSGSPKSTQEVVVPFAGNGSDALRIREWTTIGSTARLRVEPADDYAALLYDYLVRGEFALAAAAARAVARKRAEAAPLTWSSASFPQVLIGYAYAFGGDSKRLSAWCRRTDPTWSLGSDGYVLDLAAKVARSSKHPPIADICNRLTVLSGMPPPSTYFGLRLTMRLINIVAFAPGRKDSTLPPALADLQHRYTNLLAGTAPESLALSFHKPSRPGPFGALLDSIEGNLRKLTWSVLTWIRSARRRIDVQKNTVGRAPTRPHDSTTATTATPKGTTMSEDPQNTPTSTPGGTKGSPQRLGVTATAVAVLAVVLWVVFTLILFFYIDHDELQWTRLTWLFSSVQAIAFAGAGALFGTVVQKDRADKAEQRAATAEADADAQRESAVKGRALGTVLQARAAEGIGAEADRRAPMGNAGQQPTPAPDVRGEYAQLSKALFGDLMG